MLTVTDAAKTRLAQILDEQGLPEEVAVRLVYEEQGVALQQGSERPGDATFQHEGRTVLLLDADVSELLSEGTLDVEGAELTLRHPSGDDQS
jgi:Fe-S cluster assembly iron-binding protein IscA